MCACVPAKSLNAMAILVHLDPVYVTFVVKVNNTSELNVAGGKYLHSSERESEIQKTVSGTVAEIQI